MKKQLTLCYIYSDGKVLLGMKKRGFGAGKWNGFGGKVEDRETLEEAVVREMYEECGAVTVVNKTHKVGLFEFTFQRNKEHLLVHVYVVKDYKGTIIETEEMKPQWFVVSGLPYDKMWEPDAQWLPKVLAGKCVKGKYSFNENNHIVDGELTIVDSL